MQNVLAAILVPLGSIAFVALAVSGLGTLLLQFPGDVSILIALGITLAIIGGAVVLSSSLGSSQPQER